MLKIGFLALLAIAFLFFVSVTTAFFFVVFAAFLLFKIDAKYTGQAAIVCLIFIPLLQLWHREAQAEQVVVYVYFLLVITVVLQIVALTREPKQTGDTQ